MISQAKRGKTIPADDIPPEIAILKAEPGQQPPPPAAPTNIAQAPQPTPTVEVPQPSPIVVSAPPQLREAPAPPTIVAAPAAPPTQVPAPATQVPASATQVPAPKESTQQCSISAENLRLLEERKDEYRAAAIKAKNSDDKEQALAYFRTLKVSMFLMTVLAF